MNNDQTIGLEGRKAARILGYLGILPFLALAGLAAADGPYWLEVTLIAYGALILAFMAGTLWAGLIFGQRSSHRAKLELIASNILVLAAWPSVLIPSAWACLWLAALFTAHLWLDAPWRTDAGPSWYRHMRLTISVAVVLILTLGGLVGLGLELGGAGQA